MLTSSSPSSTPLAHRPTLGRRALKADPTQRCYFIEVGTGGRLDGA